MSYTNPHPIPRNAFLAAVAVLLALFCSSTLAQSLYDRSEWGRWRNVDAEGKPQEDCWDTRHEALLRAGMAEDPGSLVLRTDSSPCRVMALKFTDPYTGETRAIQASKVDIDHVVSLGEACRSGACGRPCPGNRDSVCGKWTPEEMDRFFNDPLNHIATMEGVNGSKSDRDPGGQRFKKRRGVQVITWGDPWFPPDRSFWCEYGSRRVAVKAKYGLDTDARELEGLLTLLAECRGPAQVEPLFPLGSIILPPRDGR